MFILMVSFDCGIHYDPFMRSENCQELVERTKQKETNLRQDISWTRWYIEENGERVDDIICPIHKSMFETFKKLYKTN